MWQVVRGPEPKESGWEPFGIDGGEILWRRCTEPPVPVPRFVGIEDVARMLLVDPATVRRWIHDGTLARPLKLGQTVRWELERLLASLSDARQPPTISRLIPPLRLPKG